MTFIPADPDAPKPRPIKPLPQPTAPDRATYALAGGDATYRDEKGAEDGAQRA